MSSAPDNGAKDGKGLCDVALDLLVGWLDGIAVTAVE